MLDDSNAIHSVNLRAGCAMLKSGQETMPLVFMKIANTVAGKILIFY